MGPNRRVITAAGGSVGLLIGLGLVTLFEYRDPSLRTEHEVMAAVGLPVLAAIPIIKSEIESSRILRGAPLRATE